MFGNIFPKRSVILLYNLGLSLTKESLLLKSLRDFLCSCGVNSLDIRAELLSNSTLVATSFLLAFSLAISFFLLSVIFSSRATASNSSSVIFDNGDSFSSTTCPIAGSSLLSVFSLESTVDSASSISSLDFDNSLSKPSSTVPFPDSLNTGSSASLFSTLLSIVVLGLLCK